MRLAFIRPQDHEPKEARGRSTEGMIQGEEANHRRFTGSEYF